MPHSDPETAAAYNRERWRTHGAMYRANRPAALPPISRQQALDEDVAQARVLADLEAPRIGRVRATARLTEFITSERRWIRRTSTPFVIGGLDGHD